MREIKYRVWDSWNRVMLSPEEALLKTWRDETCDLDNDYDFCFRYISLDPQGGITLYDSEHGYYANPSSKDGRQYLPLQYTSLKDKNGKEIYEGDILEFPRLKRIAQVIWYEPHAGLEVRPIKIYPMDEFSEEWVRMVNLYCWGPESIILGNIYENPELIPHSS